MLAGWFKMQTTDRERKSQRFFYILIAALLLGYAALKGQHIALAIGAFENQALDIDTTGAAK